MMHWSRFAGLHARLISDGAPSCPQAILRVLPTDKFARNPFHGGQVVYSCVSLRPSVHVRRPDGSSPALRRGGSWRGAQDARGAERLAQDVRKATIEDGERPASDEGTTPPSASFPVSCAFIHGRMNVKAMAERLEWNDEACCVAEFAAACVSHCPPHAR